MGNGFIFALCFFSFCLVASRCEAKYSPIVLIPGDGGSRIYARYKERLWTCPFSRDWSLIWLRIELFLPLMEHCLKQYFTLSYNRSDHRTYDYPGLQTEVKDWGTTKSIDSVGTSDFGFEVAFAPLTKYLVLHGFVQNVSLRGAPFDFRRAPNDNMYYFPKLVDLIEDTYRRNNNTRVMLLAHSMGNLYVNYFLRHVSREWKKKFVRGYVAVSAPVGGAVKSVLAETSGIRFSELIINMDPVRTVLRSMPSTVYNFPAAPFWTSDDVIVRTPSRNYTIANYKELLHDIGNPDGWYMYQDTSKLIDRLWSPDVDEVYCAHGTDRRTPEVLEWTTECSFPNSQPYIKHGNGDGTVNIRSLNGCSAWAGVKRLVYSKAEHKKILWDARFLGDLISILRLPRREPYE